MFSNAALLMATNNAGGGILLNAEFYVQSSRVEYLGTFGYAGSSAYSYGKWKSYWDSLGIRCYWANPPDDSFCHLSFDFPSALCGQLKSQGERLYIYLEGKESTFTSELEVNETYISDITTDTWFGDIIGAGEGDLVKIKLSTKPFN